MMREHPYSLSDLKHAMHQILAVADAEIEGEAPARLRVEFTTSDELESARALCVMLGFDARPIGETVLMVEEVS
jgi:hypothetical protein